MHNRQTFVMKMHALTCHCVELELHENINFSKLIEHLRCSYIKVLQVSSEQVYLWQCKQKSGSSRTANGCTVLLVLVGQSTCLPLYSPFVLLFQYKQIFLSVKVIGFSPFQSSQCLCMQDACREVSTTALISTAEGQVSLGYGGIQGQNQKPSHYQPKGRLI